MIRTCEDCLAAYDDEFRWTICPHETFAANDGKNNFAHHPESTCVAEGDKLRVSFSGDDDLADPVRDAEVMGILDAFDRGVKRIAEVPQVPDEEEAGKPPSGVCSCVAFMEVDGGGRPVAEADCPKCHGTGGDYRHGLQELGLSLRGEPTELVPLDRCPTLDTIPCDPVPYGEMAALFGAASTVLGFLFREGKFRVTRDELHDRIGQVFASRDVAFRMQVAHIIFAYWDNHRQDAGNWDQETTDYRKRLESGQGPNPPTTWRGL